MSKWENVLIGADGHPYLLDFQIHFRLPRGWPLRWLLTWIQKVDLYYLHRHWSRARPDQVSAEQLRDWARQPMAVRVGEGLGVWLRPVRVLILRLFGVRGVPPETRQAPSGSSTTASTR
jgi:hypothetical protein